MKILALDTSGLVASVALIQDNILTAEYTLNYKITHSQTLLPMLDEIKTRTELDLDSLDAIAVANGPGSFTGLRIGVATAKGLGLALNKPLIAVPTLEALAYNMYGWSENIVPIMDARRAEVYTGIYAFDKTADSGYTYEIREIMGQSAMPIAQLISVINKNDAPVVFLGDGDDVHREFIAQNISVPYTFAPAGLNRQKAASVGILGAKYFQMGKFCRAAECSPEYLRLSQAERERLEKESDAH